MVLWILVIWAVLSVACALAAGRFMASVDRRWLGQEGHPCLKNPSGRVEIPYTTSTGPGQMPEEASAR